MKVDLLTVVPGTQQELGILKLDGEESQTMEFQILTKGEFLQHVLIQDQQ